MAGTFGVNPTPDSPLFQKLYEKARKVKVDQDTYWLVEGDELLDEDQLRNYAQRKEALQQARKAALDAQKYGAISLAAIEPGLGAIAPSTELVGIIQNNRIVRWHPGEASSLSYCVLKKTFVVDGGAGYQRVVENMQRATKDWEETCGVGFVYKSELDVSDTLQPEGVIFTVREFDAGGQFIAASFFPNDPENRRRLLIDPSYYEQSLRFDKVGVLRHELGHVLGFRHEHIRPEAPPACPHEEDIYGTINLTLYDPRSVMHYFCGGVGSSDLSITPTDKIGAQKVYGPPLKTFLFV